MYKQPEKPRDINYVCYKVDELGRRPLGKDRTGLYVLVTGCIFYSILNMFALSTVKKQLTEVQTQVQRMENKIDTLETILKNK